jgi:regulator of replication initiation timing
MRKPAMTPGAFPHRGTAAPFRVAIGLALAVGAGTMLWGVGTHGLAFASEFGRNTARETPMTLEDRVAALTAELAQVKAETAKLRESQGDTSEELSHMRASLANAEIGLQALRTTTDENEARGHDTAAQIASNLAQLKDETLHLRLAQAWRTARSASTRSAGPRARSASRSSASRLPRTRPVRSPRATTSIRATGSGWRSAEARALPPQESGLEGVRDAEIGTFETCRPMQSMSVVGEDRK